MKKKNLCICESCHRLFSSPSSKAIHPWDFPPDEEAHLRKIMKNEKTPKIT